MQQYYAASRLKKANTEQMIYRAGCIGGKKHGQKKRHDKQRRNQHHRE